MDLQQEIEEEINWIVSGQPAGPSLEFEARDAIRRILMAHRIRGATIIARCERGTLHIDVRLPPTVPRVRQIRLRMGQRR